MDIHACRTVFLLKGYKCVLNAGLGQILHVDALDVLGHFPMVGHQVIGQPQHNDFYALPGERFSQGRGQVGTAIHQNAGAVLGKNHVQMVRRWEEFQSHNAARQGRN